MVGPSNLGDDTIGGKQKRASAKSSAIDAEVAAIKACYEAVKDLEPDQINRVFEYVQERVEAQTA